jgi:hypothetical protein
MGHHIGNERNASGKFNKKKNGQRFSQSLPNAMKRKKFLFRKRFILPRSLFSHHQRSDFNHKTNLKFLWLLDHSLVKFSRILDVPSDSSLVIMLLPLDRNLLDLVMTESRLALR